MEIKETGKGIKDRLHGAVDSVKSSVKDVKLPDIKAPDVKELFRRKKDGQPEKSVSEQSEEILQNTEPDDSEAEGISSDTSEETSETNSSQQKNQDEEKTGDNNGKSREKRITIPVRNALKVFYYLIAADGKILDEELRKFDEIGTALDPAFEAHKSEIIEECNEQLENTIDPEDYYDVLQDAVGEAIDSSRYDGGSFITPRLLLWNMLTIAYCDGDYAEQERRLLKCVVRKLNIDKAVFLEMENSILTVTELENELQWIKTTDRPYLQIEAMLNRINHRRDTIFESVMALIAL